MKVFRFFSILALVLFTMSPVWAAKNAWRQCGIGAMVFPKTGWAAVTSNVVWDFGISATLSSSSSESQCAGRASTAAKYIHQNYASLEEETASGQGAHLVTVLNILDCKKASHGKIIESVRSQFAQDIEIGVQADETYFNNLMNIIESGNSTQCQTT